MQHQEEKKEEEKNADHSSAPVTKKRFIKKRKKEIYEDEEIFGSVEEELETYRSLKFFKKLIATLPNARNADFDEVKL